MTPPRTQILRTAAAAAGLLASPSPASLSRGASLLAMLAAPAAWALALAGDPVDDSPDDSFNDSPDDSRADGVVGSEVSAPKPPPPGEPAEESEPEPESVGGESLGWRARAHGRAVAGRAGGPSFPPAAVLPTTPAAAAATAPAPPVAMHPAQQQLQARRRQLTPSLACMQSPAMMR